MCSGAERELQLELVESAAENRDPLRDGACASGSTGDGRVMP
ncbi:MAG TPA: hypothetical protein VFR38_11270 [Gaiellaceae bacterium]|nr:hypothetical protein [Gaiellaceae bacterium]